MGYNPPVITHGLLKNPPCIYGFPLKYRLTGTFELQCLICREYPHHIQLYIYPMDSSCFVVKYRHLSSLRQLSPTLVNSLRHPQCLIKKKNMFPLFPSFLMVKSQHRRLWKSHGILLRPGSCGLFDAPPGAGEGEEPGGVVGRPGGRGTGSCSILQQLVSRLVTVKHYNSYQWDNNNGIIMLVSICNCCKCK